MKQYNRKRSHKNFQKVKNVKQEKTGKKQKNIKRREKLLKGEKNEDRLCKENKEKKE